MTGPISRDDLDALIRTHRDTLWSHRWNMTALAVDTTTQTIKALEHYQRLCDVIDGIGFPDEDTDSEAIQPPLEVLPPKVSAK